MTESQGGGARMAQESLEHGREVFDRTMEALAAIRSRLGEEFHRAVDLLDACEGRVVVTGIGKSGHVARKIASTLSSTGTPAAFLHAGEATHGDLGFIRGEDVCVIVSKSGAGEELRYWIPFLRERGCPLLALTGRLDSYLAAESDLVLDVAVEKEACPHDLAPTTSSSAALVMGDALAIALLKRRGFGPQEFLRFHPSGILGRRLSLRVQDLMHTGDALPRVDATNTLRDALLEIIRKGLGMTLVLEEASGRLLGILTDGDLKRILVDQKGERFLDRRVGDFAIPNPRRVAAETLAVDALRQMESNEPGPITSLVVEDGDGRIQGVIHIHDILRAGLS